MIISRSKLIYDNSTNEHAFKTRNSNKFILLQRLKYDMLYFILKKTRLRDKLYDQETSSMITTGKILKLVLNK